MGVIDGDEYDAVCGETEEEAEKEAVERVGVRTENVGVMVNDGDWDEVMVRVVVGIVLSDPVMDLDVLMVGGVIERLPEGDQRPVPDWVRVWVFEFECERQAVQVTEREKEGEPVSDPALGLGVVAEPEAVILRDGRLTDRLNELDSVTVALALTDPVPVGGLADMDEEKEVTDGLADGEFRLPVSVGLRDGVYVGDPVREIVRVANAEHERLPDWV